jgi:hypothetical protein
MVVASNHTWGDKLENGFTAICAVNQPEEEER